ncbi:SH3 domain-containing protein [Endomicrobium proavitum]|uniref:NlpC/P60 domain-containing protein n=1 Tax=Endomicrobium proavitum TaxID=1408281 RepID=A0A0G3WJ50_9BACT|nr:SH3 domain-containing protein [Endomicrobium proavitum]AKL97912.1 exported protein of unknown function [Endomicrobium proavitum]
MKKFFYALVLSGFVFSCAANNIERNGNIIISPAPLSFDSVDRSMKSAGYWIGKIPTPDKVILTAKEIDAFNAKTFSGSAALNNVLKFKPQYRRNGLALEQKKVIAAFAKYYDGTSPSPVGRKYFSDVENNIDFKLLNSKVNVRFAMTVSYAQLRLLPSDKPLFSSLDTLDLDRVQLTQLNLGSPLAVLYATKDNAWYYVSSEIAEGWIRARSLAFCDKDVLEDYAQWDVFAVTVSAYSDIYADEKLTKFLDHVKMGTKLALVNLDGDSAEVRVPAVKPDGTLGFQKAFIKSRDVSIGYLKYTQRNVLEQAFKYLNYPYGWGGSNGEQDCSGFLKQVFECFGIVLPRNSTAQSRAGVLGAQFAKEDSDELRTEKILSNAVAGITIFYFPGHIMLYAGQDGGKPYVIHAIWGYGEDTDKYSKTYLINKVLISTLDVGSASKKGSLLHRTTLMKIIK